MKDKRIIFQTVLLIFLFLAVGLAILFVNTRPQHIRKSESSRLTSPRTETETEWEQPVASKEEALHKALETLSAIFPGVTSMNAICVLETKDSYDVVYPMIVSREYDGDDRKTEVILPKAKGGIPEVRSWGISEVELQEKLKAVVINTPKPENRSPQAKLSEKPIRVSFVNDRSSLEDTIEVLRKNGCSDNSLRSFRSAALKYCDRPFTVDVSKFPRSKDGFYEFASASAFVSALRSKLFRTDHPYEINCFDLVVNLASPQMNIREDFHSITGVYLAAVSNTNNGAYPVPVASLADGYSISVPEYQRQYIESIMGPLDEKQKSLRASICSFHTLPLDLKPKEVESAVLKTLRADWERLRWVFPKKMSLVLEHQVSAQYHSIATVHAGVIMPWKGGYMYLEKAGGQGPFLRMDVQDIADITAYYASLKQANPYYIYNYMTVDDQKIFELETPQRQATK